MLLCALAAGISNAAGRDAARTSADASSALPQGALTGSPSLYLRDAANSPIRWQPWNDSAFALARKLKRPLLIDIGAMWCHWCHVMDETTYADPKVIELLNRRYVPVKVDADERPDIDGFYQAAARAFSAGGWPLTCFADSDGNPMFIAGYLPPAVRPAERRSFYGMADLLDRISELYAANPEIRGYGAKLVAKLRERAPAAELHRETPKELRVDIIDSMKRSYDPPHGGFASGGAKFYDFPLVELALARGFAGDAQAKSIAVDTLRAIQRGGVNDQLGGGLHRYSTDPAWRVPHFEKMAYDQALAIHAYSLAFAATGAAEFADTVRSIVNYVDSTLRDQTTGAFYSHQDADASTGDDGSYYTWSIDELREATNARQGRAAILYFGMEGDPARAPDGRIVLRRALSIAQVAQKTKAIPTQVEALLDSAAAAMRVARERRLKPRVDRAVMTDRNALMVSAYLTAADALGDDQMRAAAIHALDFLRANLRAPDGGFYHVWSNSKAHVGGLAADQAYMLQALLGAFQATGTQSYLDEATGAAKLIFTSYRDPSSGLLRTRAAAPKGSALEAIGAGPQFLFDQPTPSPQAVVAMSLYQLSAITGARVYGEQADELMRVASKLVAARSAPMLGATALALEQHDNGGVVIAVVGDPRDERTQVLLRVARKSYRPAKIVLSYDSSRTRAGALPEAARAMFNATRDRSAPLAFVCAGTACANPVASPDRLAGLIRSFGVNLGAPLAK
ncbi:MAG: thioredoxin domain-containing protein [Candidatus Binataceae bacterium]